MQNLDPVSVLIGMAFFAVLLGVVALIDSAFDRKPKEPPRDDEKQ